MTKSPIKNLPESVHQRLLDKSRQTARPFNEVFQFYAIERLLFRLSQSQFRDAYVLKGALMLMVWHLPQSRPTMDIDLLGTDGQDLQTVYNVFREICDVKVQPDGMQFMPDSVRVMEISANLKKSGVRVVLSGFLGSAIARVQVDVGFGDPIVPSKVMVEYPALLDFSAPTLHGYTMYSSVAEKFHAIVQHGENNSRIKDFFDIWLLSKHYDFDGKTLSNAIQATFSSQNRSIPGEPVAFTSAFKDNPARQMQWRAFVGRICVSNAPATFDEAVNLVSIFVGPVASALNAGEAFELVWKASGPWQVVQSCE